MSLPKGPGKSWTCVARSQRAHRAGAAPPGVKTQRSETVLCKHCKRSWAHHGVRLRAAVPRPLLQVSVEVSAVRVACDGLGLLQRVADCEPGAQAAPVSEAEDARQSAQRQHSHHW